MIVSCDVCKRKYRVDTNKMKTAVGFCKCAACNHLIRVRNPHSLPDTNYAQQRTEHWVLQDAAANPAFSAVASPIVHPSEQTSLFSDATANQTDTPGMGLRSKMLLLFFVLPITCMVISNLLYIWQLDTLSGLIESDGSKIVTRLAEDRIAEVSRAVAAQTSIYLKGHANLRPENFNRDMTFRSIAVQKVGMTGYTALYEMPADKGPWRMWAHVNPEIIGSNLLNTRMGDGGMSVITETSDLWKIYTGVKGDRQSQGYFAWKEQDGNLRLKYMVCTPVAGTSYVIAANSYVDEFTRPLRLLETRAQKRTTTTRNIAIVILVSTMVLFGFVVSFFSNRMTARIELLNEVADRISVGDLDAELKVQSKDEIGRLAVAINRMQESIRLSIERLRRKG